ncbi:MAG: glycosyltransferase, partial [Minisyncoccia bacterium]
YFSALVTLYTLYPDVVFSKGGYASVPVTLAAATLGIPVFIHESDVKPGRANLFASAYARRIAVTFDSTAAYFGAKAQGKVARTGIPIRAAVMRIEKEGAREELRLDPSVPTILVLGGSSGAKRINEVIASALPELVTLGNIIHQTGKDHLREASSLANLMLEKVPAFINRYHPFAYLSALALRRAAGAADLVISRAGMTTVAEIALWGKPSLLIPIPEEISHDQRTNAYSYASTGAAEVVEETNLSSHLLVSEVRRILGDAALRARMSSSAASFANPEAGKILAEEILSIGLSHEPLAPEV